MALQDEEIEINLKGMMKYYCKTKKVQNWDVRKQN